MNITCMKINGITEPVGFSYPYIKCSWKVTDAVSRIQQNVRIAVSTDPAFSEILYQKEGRSLRSTGERLEINLSPRTRYYYYIEVTGEQGETARSEISFFETGKMEEAWSASFLGCQEKDHFHPVFFKDFALGKKVLTARIYVTGLGLYEAYLNGEKIGADLLAPFCNDYHKKIQYQTYDISDLLKEENRIEILTGNGWFKGRLGYEGGAALYGDRFGMIAELHLTFTDGTQEVLASDESWSYRGSDIASSDLYDGETVDRLLWVQGNPVSPAVVIPENDQVFRKELLVERYSLPVVVKKELPVIQVIQTPARETVLDLGQNFTGYLEFHSSLPAGTRITLDFGEVLQQGNFYNANYRTAKARFCYVSDGRTETVRPHFTYFGFRYVRVSGWPGELDPELFLGKVVYSDLSDTMKFTSSDPLLNRLAENACWGQRSNFLDLPTDCPQRDERLGWTGDAQVFSETACFQMDTRAFYRKFLSDLREDQKDHQGIIANYIPNIGHIPGGSSVWGDAAVVIPMVLYDHYGDTEDLEQNYPMMKEWVDSIILQDVEHGESHLWNFGFHFGDWLAQDGVTPQSMKGGTDDYFVASVYYYASVLKTAKAAGILNHEEEMKEYRNKAELIYQAILEEYFSPNGRLAIDTQTAYFLSLKFGIYLSRDRILEGLKLRLKKDCYRIKGGFVGATMMCQVLAEHGMGDMAAYILFQKGFPGWMRCVELGATTIWERWNSILDDGTISGTDMNSLNHYAYGSVMEYVYRYIAGIQQTEPGFGAVRFAPQLVTQLDHIRCEYDSVSGTYVSEWKVNRDGSVTVHFEVPFGCTAVVVLPGTGGEEVEIREAVFDRTYQPERDYRLLFTMDSRLEELALNETACQILREQLPTAYGLIQSHDPEMNSLSLEELKTMFFLGFTPQTVERAAEKIIQIRR